jgi:hypothetical protein
MSTECLRNVYNFCSRNLRPYKLGSKTNQLNHLSVKQNHSAQKITLSVKQK